MITRHFGICLAAATLCLAYIGERAAVAAASAPAGSEAILGKMIEAVKAESYDDLWRVPTRA